MRNLSPIQIVSLVIAIIVSILLIKYLFVILLFITIGLTAFAGMLGKK